MYGGLEILPSTFLPILWKQHSASFFLLLHLFLFKRTQLFYLFKHGSTRLNSARFWSLLVTSAQLGSTRLNAAQRGSTWLNSARLGSTRLNLARLGSTWLGLTPSNSAWPNTTQLGPNWPNSLTWLNLAQQAQHASTMALFRKKRFEINFFQNLPYL